MNNQQFIYFCRLISIYCFFYCAFTSCSIFKKNI